MGMKCSPRCVEHGDQVLRQGIAHPRIHRLDDQVIDGYKDTKRQEQEPKHSENHLDLRERPKKTLPTQLHRLGRDTRTDCQTRDDQKSQDQERGHAHRPAIPDLTDESTNHDREDNAPETGTR